MSDENGTTPSNEGRLTMKEEAFLEAVEECVLASPPQGKWQVFLPLPLSDFVDALRNIGFDERNWAQLLRVFWEKLTTKAASHVPPNLRVEVEVSRELYSAFFGQPADITLQEAIRRTKTMVHM